MYKYLIYLKFFSSLTIFITQKLNTFQNLNNQNKCDYEYSFIRFNFLGENLEVIQTSLTQNFQDFFCFGKIFYLDDKIFFITSSNISYLYNFIFIIFVIFITKKYLKIKNYEKFILILSFVFIHLVFYPVVYIWDVLKVIFVLLILLNPRNMDFIYKLKPQIVFSVLFIILFILFEDLQDTWRIFVFNAGNNIFGDMRIISEITNDFISRKDIYGFDNYIDRPFLYPIIWVYVFKFLQLNNYTYFLIFTFLMTVLFINSIYKISKNYSALNILLLISYATLLAIERGQSDIIIYLMLSVFLFSNNHVLKNIILGLTIILKFFTLPLVIFTKFKKFWHYLIFLFSILLFFSLNLDVINIAFNYSPFSDRYSFGLDPFFASINNELASINKITFYFSIMLGYFLFTQFTNFDLVYKNIKRENLITLAGVVSSTIYVTLFIFTSSFDYKLIFLIFLTPLVTLQKDKISNYYVAILLLVFNYDTLFFLFGTWGTIVSHVFKLLLFYSLFNFLVNYFKEEYIKDFSFYKFKRSFIRPG